MWINDDDDDGDDNGNEQQYNATIMQQPRCVIVFEASEMQHQFFSLRIIENLKLRIGLQK